MSGLIVCRTPISDVVILPSLGTGCSLGMTSSKVNPKRRWSSKMYYRAMACSKLSGFAASEGVGSGVEVIEVRRLESQCLSVDDPI